jgi:hypothetical protein
VEPRTAAEHGAYAAIEVLSMAEEPLVFISDKLSSDIGHLQTKPRHREGYGVWVTQNSLAKWKKRPLNFQEFEYRRSGGDTTLVLCQQGTQRNIPLILLS